MQIRLTQSELAKLASAYITDVLKLKHKEGRVQYNEDPNSRDSITFGRCSFIYDDCTPIEKPKPGEVISDKPADRRLDSEL